MTNKYMTNQFDTKKSLTLPMISLQGHRGVSSGLGYLKQAPSSGLPVRCHFRVTREFISNVLSLSPQREWSRSGKKAMVFNNSNGRSKRGFSTLLCEKIRAVHRLVSFPESFPNPQPFLAVTFIFAILISIHFLSKYLKYLSSRKSNDGINSQTMKTIIHYRDKITLYLNRLKREINLERLQKEKSAESNGINDSMRVFEPYEISRTTLRKYIHIKFIVGKVPRMTRNEILARLLRLFDYKSVIIGEEKAARNDRCIHVGIWNINASKNTFLVYIREMFPEFKKKDLLISTRKSWKPIKESIRRVNGPIILWGEEAVTTTEIKRKQVRRKRDRKGEGTLLRKEKGKEPLPQGGISEIGRPAATHRKQITAIEIFERLGQKENWAEVLNDPILGPRLLNNYLNIWNTFVELRVKKLTEELEETNQLSPLGQKLFLSFYRTFYLGLDKSLFQRITIIFVMYIILGSVPFLFGKVQWLWEFITENILWKKPTLSPDPELELAKPEPTKPNLRLSKDHVNFIQDCIIVIILYIIAKNALSN